MSDYFWLYNLHKIQIYLEEGPPEWREYTINMKHFLHSTGPLSVFNEFTSANFWVEWRE